MNELLEITAQYSNAVLVAIMPHISDFATKLNLQIPPPITASQVASFKCSPRPNDPGGRVVLMNGYEFSFLEGRVGLYRSPGSYYSLQDPARVPEFYGQVRVNESEALEIAKGALRTLGYTNSLLRSASIPSITEPPKNGTNIIPRYRFKWSESESRRPTIDIEVDAATRQIQMLCLLGPLDSRPPLRVGGSPPPVKRSPSSITLGGGRMVTSVDAAYSNAFLVAILPQLSDYVRKVGFTVATPITTNDVEMASYVCGRVEDDPIAQLYLKTGYRFSYGHGQVVACYAPDASFVPGEPQKSIENFLGSVNLTTNEAVALVREIINRLGYPESALRLSESPLIPTQPRKGTNVFSRYFLHWKEPKGGPYRVVAEVDATHKVLKSLYINDRVNTNSWRLPPKVNIPATNNTHAVIKGASTSHSQ